MAEGAQGGSAGGACETRSRNRARRARTGSGAQASGASKREIGSRERGDMGAFDMGCRRRKHRSERAEEEQDSTPSLADM